MIPVPADRGKSTKSAVDETNDEIGKGMGKYFLLFIMALSVAMVLAGCSKNDKEVATGPPVFTVTPVDIAFNPADSSYGVIPFIAPVILPFGEPLGGYMEYTRAIEYYPTIGAPVRAVTDGIVDSIIDDQVYPGEYEIQVVSYPESEYLVIYHHVQSLKVLVGSYVDAGDTLGEAGNYSYEVARTGIEVSIGQGSNERAYCPLNFGDSAFVEHHRQLLNEYNRRGFSPAYDTLCLRDYVIPF